MLTKKAKLLSRHLHTDLPCIKNIPKDNYEHQLTIIDVHFQLTMQYPDASWISERRIKQEKFMKSGFGKKVIIWLMVY